MKIKGIIFDLDGTLLYTLEDLKNSVNFSLNACNLPVLDIEQVRNFVGNGAGKLIERAIGKNKNCFEKCYKIFKQHYLLNSKNTTKPYPKVTENLIKLKDRGLKLAILSNKPDLAVKELSEYYFKGIFDIAIGNCAEFPKKPSSQAVNYIINYFNLDKKEVIFVGDSEVDIKTAKNSGIECISVTWGYKNKDFLLKNDAKYIIDDFDKILDIFNTEV